MKIKNNTIYCFGDSLTYGFGLRKKDTWGYLLGEKGWNVFNFGVNGDVMPNITKRLERMDPPLKETGIFIMGGTNDFSMGENVKNTWTYLERAIDIIHELQCIAIVGVPMLPGFCGMGFSDSYTQSICNKIQQYREIILSNMTLKEYFIADFYQEFLNNQEISPLYWDEVHPNIVGAAVMARTMENILST